MCGFAGIIDPEHRLADPAAALSRMGAALRNRGPDGEGTLLEREIGVGLTHRRLAIFDTSESGAQPMTSASGRYSIVFNGAIYNHPELRDELRQRSHEFRGTSDTEVMLAAFEEWGVAESLPRFNGMFAFAVLDRERCVLQVARDRVGQKPVFVASVDGVVAFASDLRALGRLPDPFRNALREINPVALQWYLANGAVPWPLSILKCVEKPAPGGLLTTSLGDGTISRTSWWSPPLDVPKNEGRSTSTEELLEILDQAVQRRLRSDRDIGVFLSGGLDSRLIAALAGRNDPSITAYTLAMPGPFDETEEASFIAGRIGIRHSSITVKESDILDVAVNLHQVCDEPFADASLMATTLLARRVRQEIVVALGGDGGDELFGGYRRHAAAHLGHGAYATIAGVLGALPASMAGRLPVGRLSLAEAIRRTRLVSRDSVAYLDLRRTQGDAEWLMGMPRTMDDAAEWLRALENATTPWDGRPLEHLSTRETMLADFRTYLPDDPLVKIDRASMSVALEVRCPLLDKDVIDVALGMPSEQLFDQRGGRAPIRAILRKLDLPDVSAKRGFAVPLHQWLRGPLRDWAEALISNDEDGLLDQAAVLKSWNQLQRGRRDRATTIWTILCMRSWLENRLEW